MSRPDGGSAFPRSPVNVLTNEGPMTDDGAVGMTLRDYFAGKAMQGLLACPSPTMGSYAERAYELADAMLAERSKP